jgi:hypothetical protein
MWREVIGFVGASIAVINGVLAIIIAMLPMRRSVAKLRMAVLALGLSLIAIVVALGGTYVVQLREQHELSARRDTRERLEALLAEGRALLAQIKDPQENLPNLAADQWAQRAETYLREQLGEHYVARFRKEVNEMYGEPAVPQSRLAYWRAVRNRLVNLEAIIAELPAPLRPSTVATPKL